MRVRMTVMLALTATMGLGCADAECEATTELRVTYGSDVAGEDSEGECEPLPASCGETPTCECLEGQKLAGGVDADFCLEEGTCTVEGGTLSLTCPGG